MSMANKSKEEAVRSIAKLNTNISIFCSNILLKRHTILAYISSRGSGKIDDDINIIIENINNNV